MPSYRVWVRRNIEMREPYYVDAHDGKEAALRGLREAQRLPIWKDPPPRLDIVEIEELPPKPQPRRSHKRVHDTRSTA